MVVSPDVGGLKMAHAYSEMLEADLAIVAKRRTSATDTSPTAATSLAKKSLPIPASKR